jgi:TolB-like protein/Flp pilus assembly protein TadD
MNKMPTPKFQLSLLGRFELTGWDGPVALTSKKLVGLVAFLACTTPEPHRREKLMTLLWGSHFEAQARQNLRQALARLRRVLGSSALVCEGETISLHPEAMACDVVRFEALVRRGSRDALAEAVELYKDRFLAEIAIAEEGWTEWLDVQRQRLEDLALGAMIKLGKCELQSGNAESALRVAHRAVTVNSLREDAHQLVIRALATSGRRGEALRYYEHVAELLRGELDVEPDAATISVAVELRRPQSTSRQIASPNVATGPRLSIVVLPFANLSDDPEQGYFADGLTEDITTDLSRISGSFVISHNTAFTYKGKPIDVKAVAHEVGVRYILEGSVRRLGSQVRVGAQLIDGETGAHLWAERFDHDIVDLAAFQDEVTQRIAQALSLELIDAESRSAKHSRPDNPDAVDLAMQGWSLLNQPANMHRWREARRLFEASLSMDAQLVTSLVGLAHILVVTVDWEWSGHRDQDVGRAEEMVSRALALDPKVAAAYRVKSSVFAYRDQLPEAIAAAEMATALNRNDSQAHALLARYELQSGRPERSRAVIEQGIRLSPRDPNLWRFLQILARAQIALDEDEAALTNLRKAIAANPDMNYIRLYLATAYCHMGRDKEARDAIAEFLRMTPDLMARQSEAGRTVMNAQLELAARGYYLGIVDGRIGPFSHRALAAFQRDQGIAETSDLDDVTLAKLDIAPE